jgi:NAD(P)-dependent dehydrogenase (short-subunit alcohol dehydrogenase family)
MDLELEGKVAVVTGASKGIGLAAVRTLADEGMHVVGGALTIDELGGIDGVTGVALDLVDSAGSARLVREAVERHGRIDVLVNNVGGVKLRLNGFLDVSDDDFEASLQLNFFAALRATRAAVKVMLDQGGGTIVNVASVNSFFHPDGLVIDYGAAKAALLNIAKASRRSSARKASASTASRPAPSRPTSGSATTASPPPSPPPPTAPPTLSANKQSRTCRPAASPPPKKSQPSSRSSPHREQPTSPAPTTSSTADSSKRCDRAALGRPLRSSRARRSVGSPESP